MVSDDVGAEMLQSLPGAAPLLQKYPLTRKAVALTSPKQLISPHIVTYTQNGIAQHHQCVIICPSSHYQHFLNIISKSVYNVLK